MSNPIVEISDGKIEGTIGQSFNGAKIYKFLGVPYGKTPIDELRFKAPQPVQKWNGIKDATKDGNISYQDNVAQESTILTKSEDCLLLNVYTRNIEPVNVLKPVMVFIHGGAFIWGSYSSEVLGPELLLMEDIVVVVMNYRLGLLGFLSLEDVSLDIPGNAGLKDQTLALKWVQRNIKVFGGDPNNVTLFGNSSGGSCVHFHVLSAASKGLFHKAIIQSGDALAPHALVQPTEPIAEALGKKGATDREILSILKNMTAEEILAIQGQIPRPLLCEFSCPFGPVVEKPNPSAFLTSHTFEIITSGDYNHVPLFIGYTAHEGLLFEVYKGRRPELDSKFSLREGIPWMLETTEEQNDKIQELLTNFYSKWNKSISRQMVTMDSMFLSTIVSSIINHVKTSKYPVYVYRVTVDCQRNFLKHFYNLQEFKGTCHADELGFLFNTQFLPKIQPNSLEHLIVNIFVKLWTNFATFGNPTYNNNKADLPPVNDVHNISVLNIDKDLTVLKDLPERERVELWKQIFGFSQKTVKYLKD